MNRLLTTACIVALGAAIASPAHAYVREESNWNPATLPGTPIQYYINQATIPSSLGSAAGIAAVEGGFATWAAPSCTTWRASDMGNTTTTANTGDRHNVIMWLTSWPSELGDVTSVIGVTTPVWTTGGFFIDADIQFNAQHFVWNTTGTGSGGAGVDAQSIATHEEGHFLGLAHPPVPAAIMYASYSGGIKRTLNIDDQNGVCTIYPSGVAAPDAGTVATHDAGMSTSSDPCAMFSDACNDCTQYDGCGWCGDTSACSSGTRTGPTASSCSSWAWYQTDCSSTTGPVDAGTSSTGGGRFGDPCTTPTDCSSGGICASDGTNAFCTQACADDCGCPSGYMCVNAGSVSVCAPGAGSCTTDAGTINPGNDAAVIPGQDSGPITPGSDAAMAMTTDDGGTTSHGTRASGCGCSAVGTQSGGLGASMLGLIAMGLVTTRRRRRAAR